MTATFEEPRDVAQRAAPLGGHVTPPEASEAARRDPAGPYDAGGLVGVVAIAPSGRGCVVSSRAIRSVAIGAL